MIEKELRLHAREMTPALMQELEEQGLIRRLYPGRDDLPVSPGETMGRDLYSPKEGYGPHKLITVTVDRETFAGFGTHPDCEEFWMIGDPCRKPLYLAIARMPRLELAEKIKQNTLSVEDFVLLRIKYNDPFVSCFVMLPEIPHGEAVARVPGAPPSFYVTESRDLPLEPFDLGDWIIRVEE